MINSLPFDYRFFQKLLLFFLSSRPFWNQNRPIDITGAPRHNSGPKHAEFSPNIQQAKGKQKLKYYKKWKVVLIKGVHRNI